jgi:membrane protein required for colicin V production
VNWVDIVILAVLCLSGLFGLWRGFIREVLSLATWIAALLVARFYAPDLMPSLEGLLANEMARYVLAFALLCLAVLILGALVNFLMSKLVKVAGLQLSDRLLGILFGVARGVLIVALLVFAGMNFFSTEPWWQASVLLPHVTDLIEWSRLFIMDYTGQEATTV